MKIYHKAKEVLFDFVNVPGGVVVPLDLSLFDYYEEVKIEMRIHLFPLEVRGEPKEKKSNDKYLKKEDFILKASMRLLFRYFVCLREKGHVPSILVRAKQWLLTINEETCMYPHALQQCTQWELDNCPWWIDLEGGHVLKRERELYSQIKTMEPKNLDQRKKKHGDKQKIDVESQNPFDIIHHVEDCEREDCVQGNALKGKKRLSKRTTQFVYLAEHSLGYIPQVLENPKSIVVVSDYIKIGKDFVGGKKNDTFFSVHEFMKQNKPTGVNYIKRAKAVDWAADFIFLDLPFGGTHGGDDPTPTWDFISEDHVRYGIVLASSTLADSGWLLVIASLTGDSTIGWIERYVRIYDLEIVRRVIVIHHSVYGYKEIDGVRTDCSTSILFMIRRRATEPPIFLVESTPLFRSLGMQPLDTIAYHYLPDDLRALDSSGKQWRGELERSHTFLACFVHLYCRSGGVCLEMGCGTAPILKTCMDIGRVCAFIDVDVSLMTTYVERLRLAYRQQGRHDDISGSQTDDEVDPRAGFNPYD